MAVTTSLRERLIAPPTSRPRASYRQDLITVLLCLWVMVGLMLDAWAHNNVPQLETFFTPWHAVFYSGFTATAGRLLWSARDSVRSWRDLRAAWDRLPVAYPAAMVALAGFAVSGIGDYIW